MKAFGDMMALSTHLASRIPAIAAGLERGLEQVLVRIEKTAKAEFGSYQSQVGPFPEWPELAEATKDDRVHAGFTENDPLLRSGEQRDSIEHAWVGPLEGVVGSTDPKMVYSEFGTATEPARPVMGPAAFLNRDVMQKLVGAAAVSGLIGTEQINKLLGYEMRTED